MADLLVGEHSLKIIDRPTGHTGGLEIRNPAIGRTPTGLCLDQLHERLPVRDAGGIIREQFVVGEFWTSRYFAKAAELAVVADSKDEVTIGRGKGLVWDDVGMRVAEPFG